jgi:hypothetical protein
MTKWEKELWQELETLPEEDRVVVAGAWIVDITRKLLPALAGYRREAVLAVLDRPGWDATRLAETIGSRRTTITRLAEEARAKQRKAGAEK